MDQIGRLLGSMGTSGTLTEQPMTQKELTQYKVDTYNAMTGDLDKADGYDCQLCKNRGFISKLGESTILGKDKENRTIYTETLYPCKCSRARAAIRRLQRSGLKDVVRKYTFDAYNAIDPWQKAVKDKAQDFLLDNEARCFFMGGQSGCGKTHLCTAIAVYYIKQGLDVHYMLWRDDVPKLKGMVNDPEEYAKLMHGIKHADVLYIDDLFKGGKGYDGNVIDLNRFASPTAADINLAFEIINARYNRGDGITIISSERLMKELAGIDEAVAGRIAEMSGDYCINISRGSGKNWRLKNMVEL